MSIKGTLFKLGAISAVLLTFTALIFVVFAQLRFDRTTGYSAIFENASGLRTGQFVRAYGVEVGDAQDVGHEAARRGPAAHAARARHRRQHPSAGRALRRSPVPPATGQGIRPGAHSTRTPRITRHHHRKEHRGTAEPEH